MHNRKFCAAALVAGLASAVGASPSEQAMSEPAAQIEVPLPDAALVAFGREVFDKCDGCHSVEPGGRSAAGPNLFGVVGREAGSLEGFPFTDALSASKIVWDEDSLDAYLADPEGLVPGTDMMRGTVNEPELRKALIAFLASQSTPASEAE